MYIMKTSIFFALSLVILLSSCKREVNVVTGEPKNYEMDNRERIRAAANEGGGVILGVREVVETLIMNFRHLM